MRRAQRIAQRGQVGLGVVPREIEEPRRYPQPAFFEGDDPRESLAVARRQLELMERYLRRFLAIGKPPQEANLRSINLDDLVEGFDAGDETLEPRLGGAAVVRAVDFPLLGDGEVVECVLSGKVWHEAAKPWRASGRLVVLGIAQEQHRERCRTPVVLPSCCFGR